MDTHRRRFVNTFVSYVGWLLGVEITDLGVYDFPTPCYTTPKELRKLRVDAGDAVIDILNAMAPEQVGYIVPDRVWAVLEELLVVLPAFQLFSPLTFVDTVPDYYYASDHELVSKTFGQGCSPEQVGTRWDPLALGVDGFRANATRYLMALLSQALQAYGVHYHPSLAARDLVFAEESED